MASVSINLEGCFAVVRDAIIQAPVELDAVETVQFSARSSRAGLNTCGRIPAIERADGVVPIRSSLLPELGRLRPFGSIDDQPILQHALNVGHLRVRGELSCRVFDSQVPLQG